MPCTEVSSGFPPGFEVTFLMCPVGSTNPWTMPPFALSIVAGVIWGMSVTTLSESTTTCTTLPPALSVRVIATQALRVRLLIWVGAPTTLKSTVCSDFRSKRYLVVDAAGDIGVDTIGSSDKDERTARRTRMDYLT
jgi:hypothetical protein